MIALAVPSLAEAATQMLWPVHGEIITGFTAKGQYDQGSHRGIDIYAETGTVVMAPVDGKVASLGKNTLPGYGGGMRLTLEHADDISTTYSGIENIKVELGQNVKQGEIIAVIGDSGDLVSSSLPHLHFGVYITSKKTQGIDRYQDPELFLLAITSNAEQEKSQEAAPVSNEGTLSSEVLVNNNPITENQISTVEEPVKHVKAGKPAKIRQVDAERLEVVKVSAVAESQYISAGTVKAPDRMSSSKIDELKVAVRSTTEKRGDATSYSNKLKPLTKSIPNGSIAPKSTDINPDKKPSKAVSSSASKKNVITGKKRAFWLNAYFNNIYLYGERAYIVIAGGLALASIKRAATTFGSLRFA